MSATVTDGAGKVVFTSAGAPAPAPQADPAKTSFAVQIPMKDLPPGSYVLTVTARSPAPNVPPATRQIPFTVVSAPPRTPAAAVASASPGERATNAGGVLAPVIVGPCCPNEQSYETAVRAFAHGDRGAALTAIARAPADQLKRAVDHLDDDDEQLLEAASVMHLVLGMRAMEAGYLPQMTVQLKYSDALFQKLRRSGDPAFMASWYAAATGICLSIGDFNGATAMVQRAVHEHVQQPAVLLAEGIVDETKGEMESRTLANNPTDYEAAHRVNSTAAMLGVRLFDARPFYEQTGRGRRSFDLGQAEKAYRQSLASSPDSEDAQLRLARVLSLQGKDEEAHAKLDRLLAASHDPRVLYLAHLFLADLAARRNDSATATSEYHAALAANPSSRIAYVGLSNLALLAGNGSDAQEYVRDWSRRDASAPDKAWVEYEKGIDQLQPALNALLRMIAK